MTTSNNGWKIPKTSTLVVGVLCSSTEKGFPSKIHPGVTLSRLTRRRNATNAFDSIVSMCLNE